MKLTYLQKLLISALWVIITGTIIKYTTDDIIYFLIPSIGLLYISYFILKSIVYAWIINPYKYFKNKFKKNEKNIK